MNKEPNPPVREVPLRQPATRWLWLAALLAFGAALVTVSPTRAQEAQDAQDTQLFATDELTELVGPIALYPDDLVSIVLPASTYPLQIVEAARFLEARKANTSLKPDEDWDDSIVALLNYPEVVQLLNDDLDWTWDLGTAVLNQRGEVLDAIQSFRDRAYAAGNLRTDEHQVVAEDDGAITIAPADPKVVYVPYYEPSDVIVYQRAPVFFYYPWGYPVYYYPYPVGYTFTTGFFWGVTSAFAIGWHTHLLHVHHWGYVGHPYYGWSYYEPFYTRNYIHVSVNLRGGDVWRPRDRYYGNRPIVRGREGRVADGATVPRPGRDVEGSTYRSGSTGGGGTRTPVADSRGSYRGGSGNVADGGRGTQAGNRPAVRGNADAPRVGGGMSQASERSRPTAPSSPSGQSSNRYRPNNGTWSSGTRTTRIAPPSSPTQTQSGTRYRSSGGMSQSSERARSAPPSGNLTPRSAAPTARAPSAPRTQPYRVVPQQRAARADAAPSQTYRAPSRGQSSTAAQAPRASSRSQSSSPQRAQSSSAPSGGSSYRQSGGGSSSRGGSSSSRSGGRSESRGSGRGHPR
jgi:hypothetical protein